MFEVKDLHISYGGIKALQGINLKIEDNKIVSLIGANGAGKSSTLKAIMGLIPKEKGSIIHNTVDITNYKTQDIVKRGIVLVPEGRRIFPNLTVAENLYLAAYTVKDKNLIKERIKRNYEVFPILDERNWQKAGTLSGGEQQMLAVARGLMTNPDILMLDEPSLGLAPLIINEIFDVIKKIHQQGHTILLVEQNAKKALEVSDHSYVIETGKIVLEGNGPELLKNKKVQEAYLGEIAEAIK